MKKKLKSRISIILSALILLTNVINVSAEDKENNIKLLRIPNITTKEYCVLDEKTGRILAGNNIEQKVYPASTTKILTAMLAYDHLDEKLPITVTSDVNNIPEGSSVSPYKVGESYSRADIIRGLMIPSGNDMGILIAVTVARRETGNKNLSYEECINYFCNLMNDKAKKIGIKNSNFVNPHGFHEDNHYTTPYDMALIATQIKDYPELQQIVSEKKFEVKSNEGTGLLSSDNVLYSHNEFLVSPTYSYKYATGIKTGYTEEAGYCLVASAKKDDKSIIISIFNEENGNQRAIDATQISEYIFNKYNKTYKVEPENSEDKVHLVGASKFSLSNVEIKYDTGIDFIIKDGDNIEKVYNFNDEIIHKRNDKFLIHKNIEKNDEIGTVDIVVNGEKVKTLKAFANNRIKKETKLDFFLYKVFIEKFGLLLLIVGVIATIVVFILFRKIRNIKTRQD